MNERLSPPTRTLTRERIGRAIQIIGVGAFLGAMAGIIDGLVTGDNVMTSFAIYIMTPAASLELVASDLLLTKRRRLTETINALARRS